jgi:hypothetical protein
MAASQNKTKFCKINKIILTFSIIVAKLKKNKQNHPQFQHHNPCNMLRKDKLQNPCVTASWSVQGKGFSGVEVEP